MSNKVNENASVDSTKREFMVKAGKYAVVGAGMAALMTPGASSAKNYKVKGNNGGGNGYQPCPGGSCPNSNGSGTIGNYIP